MRVPLICLVWTLWLIVCIWGFEDIVKGDPSYDTAVKNVKFWGGLLVFTCPIYMAWFLTAAILRWVP
jgi:hypothetical protein